MRQAATWKDLMAAGGLLLASLPLATTLGAHPGRLAADGCHQDRKNGGRHCHGGNTSSRRAIPPGEKFASSRSVSFANCSEARAASAAPVRRGDRGYAAHLDRDGDGIGCE